MKMNKFTILPLFSKPVYMTNIDLTVDENKILQSFCKKQKFNNFDVTYDKNILKVNDLNFLCNKILNYFNNFKNDVLNYKNKFIITTSWLTRLLPKKLGGDYHIHSNCMFSAVFYIYVDDKTGNLCFEHFNDNNWHLIPSEKKYNLYNSKEFFITPKKNDLIIFPSNLRHKVLINNSNITRYSLALNLIPVGEIGSNDSFLNLSETNI